VEDQDIKWLEEPLTETQEKALNPEGIPQAAYTCTDESEK
jgi:hypothetical protein